MLKIDLLPKITDRRGNPAIAPYRVDLFNNKYCLTLNRYNKKIKKISLHTKIE